MNYIGIFAPKIVSLLVILFSPVERNYKGILLALWLLHLILDYSAAKPSHTGVVYHLTKNLDCETGELVVNCIAFLPAIVFLVLTIKMQAWLPLIPGAISVVSHLVSVVDCIKEVIAERKR